MLDVFTRTVSEANNRGEFVSEDKIAYLERILAAGIERFDIVVRVSENVSRIVASSARILFAKEPQLIAPGGNAYTSRRMAACLRDVEIILRYITYAMFLGDSSILDDRCLNGLRETYSALGTPLTSMGRSIGIMREVTGAIVSHFGEIDAQNDAGLMSELASYFDHAVAALNGGLPEGEAEELRSILRGGESALAIYVDSLNLDSHINQDYMYKIDASLLFAFELLEKGFDPYIKVARSHQTNAVLLEMLVRVNDTSWNSNNMPDLQEFYRIGDIIGCLGSWRTIQSLQEDSSVIYVEASSPNSIFESDLNTVKSSTNNNSCSSISLIKADKIHSQERGDKAIIAFIDSGIDIFHDAFLDENIKTRILSIWDQTDKNNSDLNPSGNFCLFGKEYSKSEIQQVLDGLVDETQTIPEILKDLTGHGTSVASIAAGRQGKYFPGGVAPESQIVMIKLDDQSFQGSYGKALNYLKYIAERENLPIVVNISQGINSGAHDGESNLEYMCENFMEHGFSPKYGFIIVKSAGNERNSNLHASLPLIPERGSDNLQWYISRIQRSQNHIQLWFSSPNQFRFRLKSPNVEEVTDWIDLGSQPIEKAFSSGNICKLFYRRHNQKDHNKDSCLDIFIHQGSDGTQSVKSGYWTLEIQREGGHIVGDIHAWIEIGGKNTIYFDNHLNRNFTLTIPGTAKSIITVAAAKCSSDLFPIDLYSCRIAPADASSLGPTRDIREDAYSKPTVAAPGEQVCAALAANNSGVCEVEGTSIAAPHVAGTIALVLSARAKRPDLDQLNASEILAEIGQATERPTRRWDDAIGFGVFDASKFFQALVP